MAETKESKSDSNRSMAVVAEAVAVGVVRPDYVVLPIMLTSPFLFVASGMIPDRAVTPGEPLVFQVAVPLKPKQETYAKAFQLVTGKELVLDSDIKVDPLELFDRAGAIIRTEYTIKVPTTDGRIVKGTSLVLSILIGPPDNLYLAVGVVVFG